MTTATTYDWPRLASTSEYETLVAIRDVLSEGNVEEACAGLEELIDSVAKIHLHAVRSHLCQLMAHILKWKIQPDRRSRSWTVTIANARDEIKDIQELVPSITDETIREVWTKCFHRAKRMAELETGITIKISSLTEQEVFDDEYFLSAND